MRGMFHDSSSRRSPFQKDSVKDFLSFMPSPAPLSDVPEIKPVTPWDGEDGKARAQSQPRVQCRPPPSSPRH